MKYLAQLEDYLPKNAQEASDKEIIQHFVKGSEDNLLTRENKIAHFTSSGFVLNKTCDKILMIHHKIYDTWTWTGGHADGEEDLLITAIKEAKEETGLDHVYSLTNKVDSIDILPVWGHMKRGEYVSAHLHLNASFILIGDEEADLITNVEETHGVRWIPIDEMAEASREPELIVVYNKLLDTAKKYREKINFR